MRRSAIPFLFESMNKWYPDVAVGGASCYLNSEFYETEATLDGEEDKSLFVLMMWKLQELVGFVSCDWEVGP